MHCYVSPIGLTDDTYVKKYLAPPNWFQLRNFKIKSVFCTVLLLYRNQMVFTFIISIRVGVGYKSASGSYVHFLLFPCVFFPHSLIAHHQYHQHHRDSSSPPSSLAHSQPSWAVASPPVLATLTRPKSSFL